MGFEENLQHGLFNTTSEKTFIDKVLAKQDVDKIRELIKKPKLTRSDLLELLYMLSSTESKLVNYGAWDRYVILKFFVWIREFVKVAEMLYDYQDDLKKKENSCKNCNNTKVKCTCKNDLKFTPQIVLTEMTKKLLFNNERYIEHNAKFLIDLYLNISRTTLSLGATGFLETLKNKFELAYTGTNPALGTPLTAQAQGNNLKVK